MKLEDEDKTVVIARHEEKIKKIYDALIEWCSEEDIWSGESLFQTDRGNLGAPQLVSEMIDEILKPQVKYKS